MREIFIKKATLIHGDKYDYSNVVYVNAHTKIIVKCKKHEEDFLQTPMGHFIGSGCSKCVDRTKRRSNVEDFIEKARRVHGGKYDYSNFNYINCKIKGEIRCTEHGVFEQNANNHLQGKKCPKCSGVYKPNTNEFIEKSTIVHEGKYDYSKFNYKDNKTKGIILCKEHGYFEQTPSCHIGGSGCNKCVDRGGTQRYDTACFIEKAMKLHGDDTYDYSKVDYRNSLTKIIIICKKHGGFYQIPSSHLQGVGCMRCSGVNKKNTEDFIAISKKIHGDKYDYSKVEYIGCKSKVIIICNTHRDFEQTPDSHLQGNGCNDCANIDRHYARTSNTDEFIEKSQLVHGERYDYSKVEYISSVPKVIITCRRHVDFEQSPNCHLQGHGCPFCINKTEGKLFEILRQLYPSIIIQFRQEWCKRKSHLPFDFCIPEKKKIIELDGLQHFEQVRNWSSPEDQFENDIYKQQCANKNGYSVIRLLQEDVLYDKYDYFNELCEAIKFMHEKPKNIFLCKNNEYRRYQSLELE